MEFLPEGKKLILASKSPRRQQLLADLGYNFEVRTKDIAEDHDPSLIAADIAEYLAGIKAAAFQNDLAPNEIVLTSDTVVWCKGQSLAKAKDADDAEKMLRQLSGTFHEVITAVCLLSLDRKEIFSDTTLVYFRELSDEEIAYYLLHFRPYDKAGAYGIQEWIGMRAIEKIEGSYFTVMGLPTHLIHQKLALFR